MDWSPRLQNKMEKVTQEGASLSVCFLSADVA